MAGSIKLYGPSGYTEIAADASADDNVLTLPSTGNTLATDLDLATKLNIAGGKILQIVRATDSTDRTTTSTSFVDVTGMSVSISPQKTDSAILIFASFRFERTGADGSAINVQITDSGNNAISGAQGHTLYSGGNVTIGIPVTIIGYATPGVTSSQTYKLRFSTNFASAVAQISNATNTGQIFAIEVSA